MSQRSSLAKRVFDVVASASALAFLSPLMVVVAILVRATSPGPVLYRAARVGRGGRTFTMHKFRTMHHDDNNLGARITGARDDRISPVGRILRVTKLDEVPQFWDVLRGEMSIVGPRPEDPEIVRNFYTAAMWRTLEVRPGLTSPGSLYGTLHADGILEGNDPEATYIERLLPIKLALELVYLERQSLAYDLRLIARTFALVMGLAFGRPKISDVPELSAARRLLDATGGLT